MADHRDTGTTAVSTEGVSGWKSDMVLTTVSQAAVAFAAFWIYRAIAFKLGGDGFNDYSLSRRGVALIHPLFAYGPCLALTRQLAWTRSQSKEMAPVNFTVAAGLLVLVPLTVGILIGYIALDDLTHLLLGAQGQTETMIGIFIYLIGLSLHGLTYALFRGQIQSSVANLLEISNLALLPVVTVLFLADSVSAYFLVLGAGQIGMSLLFLLPVLARSWSSVRREQIVQALTSLVRYGMPRVPGALAYTALLSLPAIVAVHAVGEDAAGALGFGAAVVSLVITALNPISLVLLPRASILLRNGQHAVLRRSLYLQQLILFPAGIIGALLVVFVSGFAMRLFLGDGMNEAQISLVALFGYVIPAVVVYVSLRSVVESATEKALMARASYLALAFAACFWVVALATDDIDWVVFGLIAGFYALAALVGWWSWQAVRGRVA